MRNNLVITLTGHDRIGIVDQITKVVLEYHGNVEASRMARLGGEFAMLMLVSAPTEQFEQLQQAVLDLKNQGYIVVTCQTEGSDPARYVGWLPYELKVSGADHEGIVYQITHQLAEQGINIETMDTNMVEAPMSGTPLFTMTAVIVVPPQRSYASLQHELEVIGDELNVDVGVLPYKG